MTGHASPGFAIWFTGLPSSGKSTLANLLQQQLAERQIPTKLLDSDTLRQQLTPHPTYTQAERDWFYDTLTYLAELLARNGVNVLIAATAPKRQYRKAARQRLPRFAEVYVACPLEVCQTRDPKGLWRQAAEGEIASLPGAGAAYEPPSAPEAQVDTGKQTAAAAALSVLQQLAARRFLPA